MQNDYYACPYCGCEVTYGEIDWCDECDVCVEGQTVLRSWPTTNDEYDCRRPSLTNDEYDGQPDSYTEWQDYMGGDDWDHGQFDEVM